MKTRFEFIEFLEIDPKPKTKVWQCVNNHNHLRLGKVQWYGPWRQYCFFPDNAIFNEQCLDDIAEFLHNVNVAYKEKPKSDYKYFPKEKTFVLENISPTYFELIPFHNFGPFERKTCTIEQVCLYKDKWPNKEDFIHAGCVAFAVEVDGKRYCTINFVHTIREIEKVDK